MQEQQLLARRLVNTLDATELHVLSALVRGMSVKDTAPAIGIDIDEVERVRVTLMTKLGASSAADAVRVGLYAGIDLAD